MDSDVTITTSSGVHGPAIAEWTIMTVLAGTKNFATMYENQKRSNWDSDATGMRQTPDWVGANVGVLGYGSIGRQGKFYSFVCECIQPSNETICMELREVLC